MEENIERNIDMMNKNDERILNLKKEIEKKKEEIDKRDIRFSQKTNCILTLDGDTYNLHVCPMEKLQFLWIKLNMYLMSAKDLSLDCSLSGFPIVDWVDDIKSKLNIMEIKAEKENLKKMEDKLNKLLSSDKRTELELDQIENLLKN